MKKRILAIVLSAMMIVSVLPMTVFAAEDEIPTDGWYSVEIEEKEREDDILSEFMQLEDPEEEDEPYDDDETVRVSIVLMGSPTLEKYSAEDIAKNRSAKIYRATLKSVQDMTAKKISKEALGGEKLDVVWNLTLSTNIISANVEYGKIDEIKNVYGVEDVFIEKMSSPDETEDDAASPMMTSSGAMTNSYSVWAEGLTGAGTTIAVIDTGIDADHTSFDPEAFDYSIEQLGRDVDLFTKEDVAAVFDQLNIKRVKPDLTVDDVYVNSKIPFAYNYVDINDDIGHLGDTEGDHGSHVAGIAAANKYVKNDDGEFVPALDEVMTQGQAPDAQLFVMKVFGKGGGAYDSDCAAAIEDALVLGAASANLSLGSSSTGYNTNKDYAEAMELIATSSTVVAIAGGNSSYWPEHTYAGRLYAEDKNMATLGCPGTISTSLCVASVDNAGRNRPIITICGKDIPFDESGGYTNRPLNTLRGEYEYVAIDGIGSEEDFAALSSVLTGKVAICSRGGISFASKAEAAVKYGAVATIIYNNVSGAVNMDLSTYTLFDPVIGLTKEEGEFIKANSEAVTDPETGDVLYYTGTMTMPNDRYIQEEIGDYYTMSDFSSWGVAGSLELKPEITAPGGKIYSVYGQHLNKNNMIVNGGSDSYGNKSGTSMATPQVSGIAAVMAEYIKDNDLTAKTGLTARQLTNSLLMGTAVPLYEEKSDNYYPVIRQGAGLVDARAALDTRTYITMHEDATEYYFDGKVKAELGEVSRDTKTFDFTFDVNNFGDEETNYRLKADFFTQDYVEDVEYDVSGNVKLDGNGDPVTCLYMDLLTTGLHADVTWTVDGVVYENTAASEYDFNSDGVFSFADVQLLLDRIAGGEDTTDLDNADIDGDGDIDTYDAYLALEALGKAEFTVPAGGSSVVNVSVRLLDIDDYDVNGAYIEGFVYVADQSEGGVTSSIPVFGYYGGWADFGMYDYGTTTDEIPEDPVHTPYMAISSGKSSLTSTGYMVKDTFGNVYYLTGNQYVPDSVYMPERTAIEPGIQIFRAYYTLIRNAQVTDFVITNGAGDVLFSKGGTFRNAAYYANSKWNAVYSYRSIDFDTSGLDDGEVLTLTFYAAPEYYVHDGAVDWDSLPEGTRFTQQITIDDTDPDVLSAAAHRNDETGEYDAIKFTVKDDRYVAAAFLLDEDDNFIGVKGSDPDVDAEPGKTLEYTFDLADYFDDVADAPDHLSFVVADYATNYRIYEVNLNDEELAAGGRIDLSYDEFELLLGATYEVKADITPWGINSGLVWESSDDDVVTVNNGVIKGVSVGSAVITASLKDDPGVYDEMTVNVVYPEKDYDCAVWDEDVNVWLSSFNTTTLPEYKTKTDAPAAEYIYGMCYGTDGTLYALTRSADDDSESIYTLDEDTYELTFVSTLQFATFVIAPAPTLSEYYGTELLMGANGSFLIAIEAETGEVCTAYLYGQMTDSASIVSVAYAGSYYCEEERGAVDVFYFVDANGNLYRTDLIVTEDGEDYDLDSFKIGKICNPVDCINNQALYLDTEDYLVCSRTNIGEDLAQIILCKVYDDGSYQSVVAGCFEDGIWPAAGIYEEGKSIVFDYDETVAHQDDTSAVSENEQSSGGLALQSVECSDAIPASAVGDDRPEEYPGSSVIEIKADELTTNGLYRITYDPAVYEVVSTVCAAECRSINCGDGVITVAFADSHKIKVGATVAKVILDKIDSGNRLVSVATAELNDGHPETVENLFKTIDVKLVPSARLASYEIDNDERTIDVVTKKDQTLAVFQLKLDGVPQTAFTLTDKSFGTQQLQIKNVKYSEPTDAEGIRYFVSSVTNGYEQTYALTVTDKDGAVYEYTVNVYFDHTPACRGVVPGYTADASLTGFDPADGSVINVVSKPGRQEVCFRFDLAYGATVLPVPDDMPHFFQTPDNGVTYVEVEPRNVNSGSYVYMKVYKTDGIDDFYIGVIDKYGQYDIYHVFVTFVDA